MSHKAWTWMGSLLSGARSVSSQASCSVSSTSRCMQSISRPRRSRRCCASASLSQATRKRLNGVRNSWERSRNSCCCRATVPCRRSAMSSKARPSSPSSSCRLVVLLATRAESWPARQALACSRNWISGTISMR
ncbi:hypothetical protein D3C79_915190 [compost metagenome]